MELALEWPRGKMLLDFRRISIGRLPNCRIVLDDDTQVSALHAEIIPTQHEGCMLIDVGSMNGTFVNGRCLLTDVPYMLHSGDRICIGRTEFRFWMRVTTIQQWQQVT
jgi:predicted component of type VI protein secretion system